MNTTTSTGSDARFYEESGKWDLLALSIGLLVLLLATLIFGYAYSFIIYIVPFVHLNFLISLWFGFMIYYINRIIFRIAKVRNKIIRVVIVCISILFANFFQWVGFLGAVLMNGYPNIGEYLASVGNFLLRPFNMFALVGEINKVGVWSVGGIGTSGANGFPVNGFILTVVWILELIIISLPSAWLLFKFVPQPFSERLDKWYDKYILRDNFRAVSSASSFLENVSNLGVVGALKTLGIGEVTRYSKIYMYYLDGEAKQYLSVDKMYVEKKGTGKTVTSPVVSNLAISSADANDIRSEFVAKKEKFDLF
jgi:hypothetical protein